MAAFELPDDPDDKIAVLNALRALHDCMDGRLDRIEANQAANHRMTHDLVRENHDAFQAAVARIQRRIGLNEKSIRNLITGRVEMNKKFDALMAALGTKVGQKHRSIAAMTRSALLIWLGVALLAYKIIWAAAPWLWSALKAINAVLLK